jgi:REP element-mobilizing transposase RayT
MNRGRRQEKIFQDKKDYQAFIDLLKSTSEMFKVGVTAYCLMSNHYHLLIHTSQGNLNRCMRHVGGVYTQLYNRRHGPDGQLFRGRYKAILIEEEEYLLGLVRYIHHNPLKAGLVKAIDTYPWCSHKGYLSRGGQWDWLYREAVASRLSRFQYREYMAQQDNKEIERIFSLRKLPAVLGSREFTQTIKGRFFSSKTDQEVPESKFLAPSVKEIKTAVCVAYGSKEKGLYRSSRGVKNERNDLSCQNALWR